MRRKSVVYWNNIPSPYLVERFNALTESGNIEFQAWFNQVRFADRSWHLDESQWQFEYRYLPRLPVPGKPFNFPTPLFGPNAPDLLISLYAEPSFLAGWEIARLRGIRTALWCQVTFDSWVKRARWKDAIKSYMFSRVDATLGSGTDSQAFAMRYGTPAERALVLRHATDVSFFADAASSWRERREEIRHELGLTGTTFVYVGRLWRGKGLEDLISAFAVLERRYGPKVSLLLVGDGPDELVLKERVISESLCHVIFAGFQQRANLPKYYAASDVFVFPTLGDPYGLVVDEAMASSLPILSTTEAGEIRERVKESVNGFLIPARNSAAMLEKMILFVENPALVENMAGESLTRISKQTINQWVKDFESVVETILAFPKS